MASVAPPPPPPPPPMENNSSTNIYKPVANGDLNNGSVKLITPQKIPHQKKILPTIDDTRNDLLKAIRDGTQRLKRLFRNHFKLQISKYFFFLVIFSLKVSNFEKWRKLSKKKRNVRLHSMMLHRYWLGVLQSNYPNQKIQTLMKTANVGLNQLKHQPDL